MKNFRRKLIGGGITVACGITAVAAVSQIPHKTADEVTAAASTGLDTAPIIVLDAGHGEST
ncbi:MAG: hypothetical protein IKO47_11835 [Ruminococcus sp.]|nr:hypothetical protein [Ruminococcus sp.]